MQSHYLESLEYLIVIPDRQPSNPPKQDNRGQQQLLIPVIVTNPTNMLANVEDKEKKKKKKENKAPQYSKKEEKHLPGDAHIPHCTNEPDVTLPSRTNDVDDDEDVFADTSRTPQDKAESEERKEHLWQLLLKETTCK